MKKPQTTSSTNPYFDMLVRLMKSVERYGKRSKQWVRGAVERSIQAIHIYIHWQHAMQKALKQHSSELSCHVATCEASE
jgi:hypothetical protein